MPWKEEVIRKKLIQPVCVGFDKRREELLFHGFGTLLAQIRRPGLPLQSLSYTGEVVITMPDGVILKYELARQWGVGVERHRSGPIEILVAQYSDRGRCCRAVAPEQIQRLPFRDGVVLLGVNGIHLVDGVPGHAHRIAFRNRLGQLGLKRVNGSDVMHDYPDFPPVLGDTGLPLRVREFACEVGQRAGPLFEAISKGISTFAHSSPSSPLVNVH